MIDSLKPLLELQEHDLARDRLSEKLAKLPEKAQLTELEGRMQEVRAAIAAVEREADELIKEMNKLEGELRIIEEKIAKEEAKLYGGEVSNPKELSALQSEIAMLKRRKEPLEEGAIEKMVSRDDRYEERDRLRAELADLEKEADQLKARIRELAGDIDEQLASETSMREALLPRVPPDVLELYDSLRGSKRGVGAGALQNGMCTACREALSAVEVDRIKQAAKAGETMFRCEHCRRILVVS